MLNKNDLIGQKFNNLTVIKQIGINKNQRATIWLCKCDCGNNINVITSKLKNNHTKSCGCLKIYSNHKKNTGHKNISGTFYGMLKKSARLRNLEFNLSKEQLQELLEKQNFKCAFTGLNITISDINPRDKSIYWKNTTASVDRIDSNKGYTIDNIQFVHKDINYLKKDFTDEEFINYCNLVSNYRKTI